MTQDIKYSDIKAAVQGLDPASAVEVAQIAQLAVKKAGAEGKYFDGSPSTSGAVFVPSARTYGGIMDAYNRAVAAGVPATVLLEPELYDIAEAGQGIPFSSRVTLAGSGYQLNTAQMLTGGTIIQGNGLFDLMVGNDTDNVEVPANTGLMMAEGIRSAHLRDLALKDGRTGLKVGAKWKGGAYNSSIRRVRMEKCLGWALDLENWQYSHISEIDVNPADTAVGSGRFAGSIPNTLFNHGNLNISELFSEGGGARTRGWVFMAYGGNSNFNDLNVYDIQRNASGVPLSVAATMTNGSPNVGVPDSSLFPVDLPVTVSASANGFTRHRAYFVVYSVANVVRLSDTMGGATLVNATGSTAVNLVTYGPPCLEVVGYGDNQGNQIQASSFVAVDAESTATNQILLQNADVEVRTGFVFNTQGVTSATSLCARSSGGTLASANILTCDFDGFSSGALMAAGLRLDTQKTQPQNYPQGLIRDTTSNTIGFNLGSIPNGSVPLALYGLNTSGRAFIYPANPMGQRVNVISSTSNRNLAGQEAGCTSYVGTASVTWTLPTLSGAAGAVNTYNGTTFELANSSTTAGVVLTINTAAGQPFNRQSAKTSVALGLGQSLSIRAQTNNGADWFWQVTGTNGVTV